MIQNHANRPVVLLGAGVLGRRIATVFVAGGYTVHIRDPSPEALTSASEYINDNKEEFAALNTSNSSGTRCGTHRTFTDIAQAVKEAWLVIEAVPENLDLKRETFAEVDRHAPGDCVIASNSSSFKSRLMMDGISAERKARVLNMHFTMPPDVRTVELMTSGETSSDLFPFCSRILRECGMAPVTARKESTGFIFNRLWAAIKREILFILAEGVSSPEEIDLLWTNMFQKPESQPPCRLMDQVGLDTVAFIEDNYIRERGLDGRMTVDWLREKYIQQGKLGNKSDGGGLYPKQTVSPDDGGKELYLLDVGLGNNNPDLSQIPTAGRVLRFDAATRKTSTIVSSQNLPDGIDVSPSTGRIFWTNMGKGGPSTHDGSINAASLDGSDVKTVLAPGTIHTPKQLVVDDQAGWIYFCDREGMGVHRVEFSGANHQVLVSTGSLSNPEHKEDQKRWCVGITLDKIRGHIYWTQKGPSKGGQGRIFRAGMDIPAGQTAENRSDIELVLQGLPEPIDLEFDEKNQMLYWTDRGEHPLGCSLNRAMMADLEKVKNTKQILARQFHEPIGLKLDRQKKAVYVSDLGGCVHLVRLNGEKELIYEDSGCYTGLCLV